MNLVKCGSKLLIQFDSKDESDLVDKVLGKEVHPNGLIAFGEYELRLRTNCANHYVILHQPTSSKYIVIYPLGDTVYQGKTYTNSELAQRLIEMFRNDFPIITFPMMAGWCLKYRDDSGKYVTIFDGGPING